MLQDRKELRRVMAVACFSMIAATIVTLIAVLIASYLTSTIPTVFRPIDDNNILAYNFVVAQLFGGATIIAMMMPFRKYNFSLDKMTVKKFLRYSIILLGLGYILNLVTQFVVIPIIETIAPVGSDPLDSLVSEQPTIMLIVFVVILGPIAEELIFRQVVLSRLLAIGQKNAIILQGVLFGIFHFNLYQFFYTTAIGILLGYITVRYGSFKYAVYLHMILNFCGSVLPMLAINSEAGTMALGLMVIAFIIVTIVMMVKSRNTVAFSDDERTRGNMRYVLTSPLVIICLLISAAYTIFNLL